VRRVQSVPLLTSACILVLVAALSLAAELPRAAVVVGIVSAVAGPLGLHVAQRRYAVERLGPADRVTVVRGVLVCGVLALAAGDAPALLLAALLTPALVLDGVDGRVARRTGTASEFGARLDMEVDALLILVLSWAVATDVAWWVLGIGLARYVFAGLVWLLPALQHQPPPRSWCKTVAVLVAMVLAATAVGVLPDPTAAVLLAGVAALLLESFGREVCWLWRSHRPHAVGVAGPDLAGPVRV